MARTNKPRSPGCIVLAPTRELAKQVEREFAATGPTLRTACVYGGKTSKFKLCVQCKESLHHRHLLVSNDSWPAAFSSDLASGTADICTQTQHGTDRLHSSAVSPRSVRQGLRLGTPEINPHNKIEKSG